MCGKKEVDKTVILTGVGEPFLQSLNDRGMTQSLNIFYIFKLKTFCVEKHETYTVIKFTLYWIVKKSQIEDIINKF